jgi:hypothetical protein
MLSIIGGSPVPKLLSMLRVVASEFFRALAGVDKFPRLSPTTHGKPQLRPGTHAQHKRLEIARTGH